MMGRQQNLAQDEEKAGGCVIVCLCVLAWGLECELAPSPALLPNNHIPTHPASLTWQVFNDDVTVPPADYS